MPSQEFMHVARSGIDTNLSCPAITAQPNEHGSNRAYAKPPFHIIIKSWPWQGVRGGQGGLNVLQTLPLFLGLFMQRVHTGEVTYRVRPFVNHDDDKKNVGRAAVKAPAF
jgi:hypothetical protein